MSMPSALPSPELAWVGDLTVTVAAPIEARILHGLKVKGPSTALHWMTESLFIAAGAPNPDCAEMRIFRVG